jgi:hypothetical protein
VNGRALRAANILVLALALLLVRGPLARAAESPVQRLVRAYSPIVMLRAQEDPPCNTAEEQYEPTTVDTVLGNPRVKLVREGRGGPRQVARAPTASDIAGLGSEYHLDLPGNPLEPGCTYARGFAAIRKAGRAPPVTYAHIAKQAGHSGFVAQYWFFYYFNQFNDLHESDWEGMQIVFDAGSAEEALASGPAQIVLFQHSGGEKADWDDDKVEKEGTHPVVYPAAGSHATFYESAIFVENGQGGSGLGCDNTSRPVRRVAVQPRLVPTAPRRGSADEWLTYDGRWGQKEKGYNNGPTGPNTKTQWREPFDWMEGVRSTSPTLPGGSVLGPAATHVFCGAVASASSFVNLQARSALGATLLALAALLIVAVPAAMTRWRPVDLSRLRQPRAFGQLIRAARQLYGRHWRTFIPIGLTAIPIIAAIEAAQWVFRQLANDDQVKPSIHVGGARLELSSSLSGVGRPLGFAVTAAAAISVVCLLERGAPAGFVPAYRATLHRFWRVVIAQLLTNVLVIALMATVIGIPIAIWKYVGWQFVQQEVLFEDKAIRAAFRGSSTLVRGRWWRTLRVAGFFWLISVIAGPVLGFVLIFADVSLTWVNVVGSLVFALVGPYVAIGRTFLYLDLSAREPKAVTARRWRPRRWLRTRATGVERPSESG